MNLILCIIAHLIGDFLFQNHWMQTKAKNTLVCLVHIAAYSIPFCGLVALGCLPAWVFLLIILEHFLQDRFALHLKWMRFYGQTKPELWPVGPLCMDQSFHLAFIGCLYVAGGFHL